MAYPISQEALDLFTTPYRQIVDISFYGTSEELHLTEQDIVLGGLSVNRYYCKPGKAKITQDPYKVGKSKHPYHLVAVSGGGSNVYGWVDAGTFEKA